jgi:hypothetical protein
MSVRDTRRFLISWSKAAVASTAAGLFPSLAFAAGIQFQCGASKGYAHFSDQGLATGQGGWDEDGVSDGETIVRIDLDSGEVVVRFKDATGDWSDVADIGGRTELWHAQYEPVSFGIMVSYTGDAGASIEVSTISEVDFEKQTARLTTTQSRVTEMFTNSRVLTSSCRLTAF